MEWMQIASATSSAPYDDVIKWKHFLCCRPFVRGIHWSPVDSLTKTSVAELWCFLWSAYEKTVEQTIGTPMIWDAIALIMTSLQWTVRLTNDDQLNVHNRNDRPLPIDCRYYSDAIMGAMASQITSLTIVYSTVYSGADQRKHQGSASLAFLRGIHRSPVNSPHIWPVTREMVPFDGVIMQLYRDITCVILCHSYSYVNITIVFYISCIQPCTNLLAKIVRFMYGFG